MLEAGEVEATRRRNALVFPAAGTGTAAEVQGPEAGTAYAPQTDVAAMRQLADDK
jgi:hypothetical protein